MPPGRPRTPIADVKAVLLIVCSLAIPLFSTGATQVPVSVTGFNQDMVVDVGTLMNPVALQGVVTATMDGGATKRSYTWYELGEDKTAPTTGLPMGTTFVSSADPTTSFSLQLATGMNALMLDSTHANGNLTFTTPGVFSSLSLLGASDSGPTTVAITLEFTDSSTLSLGNVVVPDWFNNTPTALAANGRLDVGTATFGNVNSGNPRLYQFDLTLAGVAIAKQISGIAFTDMSGGSSRAGIFAVSGTFVSIPEPGITTLLISGVLGLVVIRRSRFIG